MRRAADDDGDDRLLIDDSKKVHDGPNGFTRLEHGVLAALAEDTVLPFALGDMLKRVALEQCRSDLLREPWFDVTHVLPGAMKLETILATGKSFHFGLVQNELTLGPIQSVVTPHFHASTPCLRNGGTSRTSWPPG